MKTFLANGPVPVAEVTCLGFEPSLRAFLRANASSAYPKASIWSDPVTGRYQATRTHLAFRQVLPTTQTQ